MLSVGGTVKALLLGGASFAIAATPSFADGFFSGGGMKDAPSANKLDWSAYVQGTTDYIFRGLSQNRREPTIQGGVDISYGMFYIGTFVSGVNFELQAPRVHQEVDIYGGIKPKWGAVTFDFGVIGYLYPVGDAPLGQDYFELKAGASTTVWKDVSVGATFFYSPNTQNDAGATYVLEGTVSKPIYKYGPLDFAASATVGGFWWDEPTKNGSNNQDYAYYNVGITTTIKENFSIDLRYWNTSLDDKKDLPCGQTTFQCGGAFVATAKASF